MRDEDIQRRETRRGGGFWPAAGAVALAVVLSGCSSVPDAANPVKWYTNTVDYFSGDKEENAAAEGDDQALPGAEKPFPNLATVPAKPQVSSAEERNRIAQGLVSDSERRRYAPEVSRQGAPAHVLGDSSAPASAPASGALPALPPAPAPAEASKPAAVTAPPAAPAAPPPAAAAPVPAAPAAAVHSPAPLAPSAPPPSMAESAPPPPQMNTAASAPAARPTTPPAPPMAPATGIAPRTNRVPATADPFETVVVSSAGVDAAPSAAAPSSASAGERMAAPRSDNVPDAGRARGQSIRVATIQFANGSADLDSRDRTILRNVVALQRERGGVIRVVGHASARTADMDAVRHKLVNYEMSSQRAAMVAKALADLGARPQDIVVVANADTDPLYYEFMPSGEAGNRRTEVYLDF